MNISVFQLLSRLFDFSELKDERVFSLTYFLIHGNELLFSHGCAIYVVIKDVGVVCIFNVLWRLVDSYDFNEMSKDIVYRSYNTRFCFFVHVWMVHTRVLNFKKELLDLRVVSDKVFVLQIKEEFQVDRIVILRCVLKVHVLVQMSGVIEDITFVKVNNFDEIVLNCIRFPSIK